MRSMPAPRKTSSWSPWPISWRASHGLCYPAEKTTDQTATWSQHRELARKRRLRLGSADALHFTALRRWLKVYPPRSAQKQQGRKNSHNGVPGNLLDELVDDDRPTNKDRYGRNSSWPGAMCSTQRPNTFAQTCLLALSFFLAVRRRTIHTRPRWRNHKRLDPCEPLGIFNGLPSAST
jgi:hypothetical protein